MLPESLPFLLLANPSLLPSTMQLPERTPTATPAAAGAIAAPATPPIPPAVQARWEACRKALQDLHTHTPAEFLRLVQEPFRLGPAAAHFAVDACNPQQLTTYTQYYGLLKWRPGALQSHLHKHLPGLRPAQEEHAPSWLARATTARRKRDLARFLAEVRADDAYLAAPGALAALTQEALHEACQERGILLHLPTREGAGLRVRPDADLRRDLGEWVALSVRPYPRAADLQLVTMTLVRNGMLLQQHPRR